MANQWYPFYPGDYSRDTAHLSLLEHGAYRLLLDHYYANGGPLPAEPFRLFYITRAFTEAEQAATMKAVALFFKESPGGFINRRADRVLAEQETQQEKRKTRAAKGAAARWGKVDDGAEPADKMLEASKTDASSNAYSNAYAMLPQPQPQEPITYIRTGVDRVVDLIKSCIEERRPFIRDRFGFTDAEIDIEVEEILIKCRAHSPGPDVWLYISRWFKNRRGELDERERKRNERAGSAQPGGPARRTEPGGAKGGGLAGGEFVDKSGSW